MPHPPIIIPNVGKGEEKKIKKTSLACEKIAKEIKTKRPETIIIITPHGLMFRDVISLSYDLNIGGSLHRFNAPDIAFNKEIDVEMTDKIDELSKAENIPTIKLDEKMVLNYHRAFELDHGSLIPLYFIEKEYQSYRIVHITYSLIKGFDLFRFGNIIKEAVLSLNRKVVIIASGDLSHRLTKDGPYPYSPKGQKFDELLLSLLEQGDIPGIMKIKNGLSEEAGECGLRSIQILLGALNNEFRGELLSYEGPFGVGYGVMKMIPENKKKDFYKELLAEEQKRMNNKLKQENIYLSLARESIAHFFQYGKMMELPKDLPQDLVHKKAGVFVSLKKHGHLRGCIGTYLPTKGSIGEEIIHNAISAAFQDPRFNPLHQSELDELEISIDILSQPIKAKKEELNPKLYGVIVSSGYRRGLLLPDLEGVDSVEQQLQIACEKAGIPPHGNYEIYKFTVARQGK